MRLFWKMSENEKLNWWIPYNVELCLVVIVWESIFGFEGCMVIGLGFRGGMKVISQNVEKVHILIDDGDIEALLYPLNPGRDGNREEEPRSSGPLALILKGISQFLGANMTIHSLISDWVPV